MIRKLFVAVVAAVSLCAVQAGAMSMTLTLTGVGPTGTVTLGGTQSGLDHGTFYAGVLDWKDGSNTPYYSYCIDDSHTISINNTYHFNALHANGTDGALPASLNYITSSATKLSAIGYLFAQHDTGVGAPGDLLATNHNSISGSDASAFQVALWDVIYDTPGSLAISGNSTSLSIPLSFSDLSPGSLSTADSWAVAAINAAVANSNYVNPNLIMWAATDSGQNQAFFTYSPNTPVAPAPSSVFGGLALLGVLGASKLRRRSSNDSE